MKTVYPNTSDRCVPVSRIFLTLTLVFSAYFAVGQNFKGRDGNGNYSTAGSYILNRYTSLTTSATSGQFTIAVSNINQLNGNQALPNFSNPYLNDALSQGDLVLIVQVQGADVNSTNTASFGGITSYNNVGNYEVKTVYSVSGNTIYFCEELKHNYSQGGKNRTQVVRIPRFNNLVIAAGVTITGNTWNGISGGVVALEVNGTTTLNGVVSASTLGFRGGVDDIAMSISSGIYPNTVFVSTWAVRNDAQKGESIAGNSNDYETYFNGSMGRGAIANGGGGGNGHNSGGGGGSNAGNNGVLTPWNGTGVKDISTAAWANAWNLESAGFSSDISMGGGRGGYSYSNSDRDALTVAPDSSLWGGNRRQNVGGFGGRPLNYNNNTRLFMGGGGGAGDGNNSSAGNGGNGGGIVYMLCTGNVSGAGSVSANGQIGYSTFNAYIDAAGGGGGGGAIVLQSAGTITGITLQANGGKGGDQLYLTNEAEGPGGGGGGGYILTTSTSVTRQVNGGANGISNSTHVTEFLPNGATQGSAGTVAGKSFTDVFACDEKGFILPVTLVSFSGSVSGNHSLLTWESVDESGMLYYELERSSEEATAYTALGRVSAENKSRNQYRFTDLNAGDRPGKYYYRLRMVGKDGRSNYSPVAMVRFETTGSAWLQNLPTLLSKGREIRISLPENVSVDVFTAGGQRMGNGIEKNNSGFTLHTGSWSEGIYVVRVYNQTKTEAKKIVLQ